MELSTRLTNSQARYQQETDSVSSMESTNNSSYLKESEITKEPAQPESAQIATCYHSLSSRPHSFPYEPTTISKLNFFETSIEINI
ncbi:unnamed protein product [Rotaria sp. Silwood2]|nr:unnamed protein product [Rotaria sp. Silwood2]CAF4691307.1 unnamed protein product [Rotaria sp. Silwood2]